MNIDTLSSQNKDANPRGRGRGGRGGRGGENKENEKTTTPSNSTASPKETTENNDGSNNTPAYNNYGQWSNNSLGSWNNNNSSQNKGKAWKCVCCFKTTYHELYGCKTFLSLDQEDRYSHAREAGACLRCLLVGHKVAQCQNTDNCQHCNKPHHHSLLHRHTEETEKNKDDNDGSDSLSDYAE